MRIEFTTGQDYISKVNADIIIISGMAIRK